MMDAFVIGFVLGMIFMALLIVTYFIFQMFRMFQMILSVLMEE